MLIIKEEKLCIKGCGETEEFAFQEIFSQVKSKLSEKYSGITLQIEPQKVEIIEAKVHVYTERFLGFLFPRKCRKYQLLVNLTVKVCWLDTKKIIYEEVEEKLSVMQHVLKMQ